MLQIRSPSMKPDPLKLLSQRKTRNAILHQKELPKMREGARRRRRGVHEIHNHYYTKRSYQNQQPPKSQLCNLSLVANLPKKAHPQNHSPPGHEMLKPNNFVPVHYRSTGSSSIPRRLLSMCLNKQADCVNITHNNCQKQIENNWDTDVQTHFVGSMCIGRL